MLLRFQRRNRINPRGPTAGSSAASVPTSTSRPAASTRLTGSRGDSLRSYDPTQLAPAVRPLYHGDPARVEHIIQLLDFRLQQPLQLSDAEIAQLVAFLKALTDPSARDLRGIAPTGVPSGLRGLTIDD